MITRICGFGAILLAMGCGGSLPASTVPRPIDLGGGRSVEALLPADTTTVIHVDLAGVRASELYDVIGEDVASWGRALEAMGDEEEAAATADGEPDFFELASEAEWIVLASSNLLGEEEDEPLAFLGARLTEAQARGLAKLEAEAALEAADDIPLLGSARGLWGGGAAPPMTEPPAERPPAPVEVQTEQAGGRTIYVAGDVAVTEIVSDVWIMGPRERAMQVLERMDAEEAPTVEARTHALSSRVALFDHQIALAAVDLRDAADEVIDEDDELGRLLATVEGAAFHLDLAEGVDTVAVLETTDAGAAGRLASYAQAQIRELIDEDTFGSLGLPRLLARVEPRPEAETVRFDLHLDRAQAHLWWGRISGLVGGAIVVVDLLSGLFGGAASALEDMEMPDADAAIPVGGTIEAHVTSASAGAPVQPDAQCTIRVLPAEDHGDEWTCHAMVVCEGKPLYGGADSGWFRCELGEVAEWHARGADESPTSVDGDPVFSLDTTEHRARLGDDATGRYGEYELEIGIDAVTLEPQ